MKHDFSGRVALVTGGTSGIGRAIAIAFAKAGADVVISGLPEGSKETLEAIAALGVDCEADFIAADVRDEDQVEEMVEFTLDRFGRMDYACNNAGIALPDVALTDLDVEDWDRVMDINLKGLWLCMKHQIPYLLKQLTPAIVNTASVAGLVASPGFCYTASKHGVVGLTKAAALNYAKTGLRINAICPGLTNTPIVAGIPMVASAAAKAIPMGRIGEPDDMANAVLWLCSEQAAYITGHSLVVDGGYTVP
ncbi:MAG: glucose 1-dehydrogenase [Porticoccaceae bacterium]